MSLFWSEQMEREPERVYRPAERQQVRNLIARQNVDRILPPLPVLTKVGLWCLEGIVLVLLVALLIGGFAWWAEFFGMGR